MVLEDIPFGVDAALLARRLSVEPGTGFDAEIAAVAAEAGRIGRPRAVYRAAYVDARAEGAVTIGGIVFTSRVLRVNLDSVHRVFPYVLTCGMELQRWGDAESDPLTQYWIEAVKEIALRAATEAFEAHLADRHGLGKSSRMNPGSLPDWPLPEQGPLFRLLGDVEPLIGVRLSESFVMLPNKSVSGIRFPTESTFESCQLCPREVCPGRRAPYDGGLYEKRYRARSAAAHS